MSNKLDVCRNQRSCCIMVDMDLTLVHVSIEGDTDYKLNPGREIKFYDENGKNPCKCKVSIRPFAHDLIRNIVKNGHLYIVWSAGTYDYVHGVMKYFNSLEDVPLPFIIYTRNDMIKYGPDEADIYKSMEYVNFTPEEIIIIDDNCELIHPNEHKLMVKINPWHYNKTKDTELIGVINYLDSLNES